MLLRAHSLQNISPWVQDTGFWAGIKHSLHEAKGKNESLERRALFEPHADFASDLSYEVKTARDVLRLPESLSVSLLGDFKLVPHCVTCSQGDR